VQAQYMLDRCRHFPLLVGDDVALLAAMLRKAREGHRHAGRAGATVAALHLIAPFVLAAAQLEREVDHEIVARLVQNALPHSPSPLDLRVKGKGDGIQDRRLSAAGRTEDAEKSSLTQAFKVDILHFSVAVESPET